MFNTEGLIAQNGDTITPSDTTLLNFDGFFLEQDSTVHFQYRKRNNTAGNERTLALKAGYHPRRLFKVFATGSIINGIIDGMKG